MVRLQGISALDAKDPGFRDFGLGVWIFSFGLQHLEFWHSGLGLWFRFKA